MESDGDGSLLWECRYQQLQRWSSVRGQCAVPKAEGKLGRWVVRQRELRKKGKLEAERVAQLDALGFVWNTNEAAWERRFELLHAYMAQHGHCCVPISDPSLGMWVAKMRANRRRGKLAVHRVHKLNTLNFVWNTAEADWGDKFQRLLEFRERQGHACVPFNEGELGWWVNTQRQSKRKGKLSKGREDLLNNAGFVWNPQEFLAARRREAVKARTTSCSGERKRRSAVTDMLNTTDRDHSGSDLSVELLASKRRKLPVSPVVDGTHVPSISKSRTTQSTGRSKRILLPSSSAIMLRSMEASQVTLSGLRTPCRYSASYTVDETSCTHGTDRLEIPSVDSLLSHSPQTTCTLQTGPSVCRRLEFPRLEQSSFGEQTIRQAQTSDSRLPTFLSDRVHLRMVSSGMKRSPSAYGFVLPPISSLKMLSNPFKL